MNMVIILTYFTVVMNLALANIDCCGVILISDLLHFNEYILASRSNLYIQFLKSDKTDI